MKIVLALLVFVTVMSSCEQKDKTTTKETTGQGTQLDSLIKDIDDGHVVGMSKIGKLHNTKKQVQAVLDSIAKLPAKTQAAAAPYVERLQKALNDLDFADLSMDKWMMEYNQDSIKENLKERLRYLTEEKLKVSKIKSSVLNSIEAADSLIRAKF